MDDFIQSLPCVDRWCHKHLLGLEYLPAEDITLLLDVADRFRTICKSAKNKLNLLSGRTVCTLFFENSTRTRNSFTLAAQRLGASVLAFAAGSSSMSKGETVIDTARNIEAMGVDTFVVRHNMPGAPKLISEQVEACILNAGDGAHAHPTQALLDLLTIRQRLGTLEGKTVALVGDIAHSRVARSNIWGLKKLGARVILCGPSTLVSTHWKKIGVEYSYNLDDILPEVDVLNLLRIQFERQQSRPFPSVREYELLYTMNSRRLAKAKKDVLIIAPGPINRGVEVTAEVADGPQSAIIDQVTNGLAVRMAALWLTDLRRSEK